MEEANLIKGNTEQEILKQIKKQLSKEKNFLKYKARIEQGGQQLELLIDIDLGGGFQSGMSITRMSAKLVKDPGFEFLIYTERLIDNIGKFFGMQDVVIGYTEFDDKMIIKTNNEKKIKKVFGLSATRKLFNSLSNFSLHIDSEHKNKTAKDDCYLILDIEEGITNLTLLGKIYKAFNDVLRRVNQV